jgi:hypothetical protein
MSLILFDGLDNAVLMPKPGFVGGGNTSGVVTGRDGSTNGAWGCSGSSLSPAWTYVFPVVAPTVVIGFGFNSETLSSVKAMRLENASGIQLSLCLNGTTGRYELRLGNAGTLLDQSSAGIVYSTDTWVHIQMKALLDTSSGSCVVKLNDVEIINYTGQTATANGDVTQVSGSVFANGSKISYDDLWVCDTVDATATQGRAFDDFLGDLKVVTLVPDGAGDSTDWTPSTGSNYATLDENPPTTSDYVSDSADNTGDLDLYTATDLPGPTATVLAYQSKLYARKNDSGTALVDQMIKENGVTTSLSSHALSTTVSSYTSDLLTQRPSDGALFTVTDINDIQIGVEVGS